jgi:hypothetical protein
MNPLPQRPEQPLQPLTSALARPVVGLLLGAVGVVWSSSPKSAAPGSLGACVRMGALLAIRHSL